ncbi:hypothetical protein BGW36DRAFT_387266 [Talaromyces proteolyticus]|uniref:Uncharacterized protein n=1 Tax=Talaromyces proteolyticus TaxID=1131652 RepID=A0AAD4KM01_9EURO|nr:uncharacterized protein BGW36DRAFT_387266 [Talaromyces proteolyticus]KAH8692241.1 hypothetical protein BGW36DRAFT_387266 [Talaromyces proteolyticus]
MSDSQKNRHTGTPLPQMLRPGRSQPRDLNRDLPATPGPGSWEGFDNNAQSLFTQVKRDMASKDHGTPFEGTGQVTYSIKSPFNKQIKMSIYWNGNEIFGQFCIAGGHGEGFMRYEGEMALDAKVDSGDRIELYWRGYGGFWQQIVPAVSSDCTKLTLQFHDNGDYIIGEISPFDEKGAINWHPSRDGNMYLDSQTCGFAGVAIDPKFYTATPENAKEGYDKFGPDMTAEVTGPQELGRSAPDCTVSKVINNMILVSHLFLTSI